MIKKLKPYMVYSRALGPVEGAVLVFHHTAREAKVMAWKSCISDITDEYIDVAVSRIRTGIDVFPLGDTEKIIAGIPHFVDSPEVCQSCELWGCGLEDDGICEYCGQFAGERLVILFDNWLSVEVLVS